MTKKSGSTILLPQNNVTHSADCIAYIAAAPEKLCEALTDNEIRRKWWCEHFLEAGQRLNLDESLIT